MKKKFLKQFQILKDLPPLKKASIIFGVLLLFIILVEQPGSASSKRKKSAKYFVPKLVVEEASSVSITEPGAEEVTIELEKKEAGWLIANGRLFPADFDQVDSFLKQLHSLKEGDLVSRNPERKDLFGVNQQTGYRVEVWDMNERKVADFYAGKVMPGHKQYLRKEGSDEVIQVHQVLNSYLALGSSDWKDKTILEVNEVDVKRMALKDSEGELVIERQEKGWKVTQPEVYEADMLAMRTLFEELKKLRADGFADSVEVSQVNFEEAEYKLSVRMMDDTLKAIFFVGPNDTGEYLAKNGEKQVIYKIDHDLLDRLFNLEFKSS